jgi:hypothetical protein
VTATGLPKGLPAAPLRLAVAFTLAQTTVSGLEPGRNDCGKAAYQGSEDRGHASYYSGDDDAQGADEHNDDGGHDEHTSQPCQNPAPRPTGWPGGGRAAEPCPSCVKLPAHDIRMSGALPGGSVRVRCDRCARDLGRDAPTLVVCMRETGHWAVGLHDQWRLIASASDAQSRSRGWNHHPTRFPLRES